MCLFQECKTCKTCSTDFVEPFYSLCIRPKKISCVWGSPTDPNFLCRSYNFFFNLTKKFNKKGNFCATCCKKQIENPSISCCRPTDPIFQPWSRKHSYFFFGPNHFLLSLFSSSTSSSFFLHLILFYIIFIVVVNHKKYCMEQFYYRDDTHLFHTLTISGVYYLDAGLFMCNRTSDPPATLKISKLTILGELF